LDLFCPLAFNGQIFWGHELEGLGQVLGGSLSYQRKNRRV